MAMEMDQGSRTADRSFERKILRARLAAVLEQLWLKLWLMLAVAIAFILVSYTGIWAVLPGPLHVLLLAAFGVAMLAVLVSMARIAWPSREDAIRRIERVSGVPHRPASSYEDTLSSPSSDPATLAIWHAHRERMAALLAKLRAGKPQPRTDRFDPFAVRAALLLGFVGLTGLLGHNVYDRVRSAFVFPLKAEGKTIGVLAFNSREIREPDAQLLAAVRSIGGQVGGFLQRRHAEAA